MGTFVVGLLSAALGGFIGAGIKVWFDRYQATWSNRRSVAADAFGAAVAVHSAVLSALRLARQVAQQITAYPGELHDIAHSADWYITNQVAASKARLDKLREARLSMQTIWGPHVGALFDDYFELTSAWHNAFASFGDDINGHVDPEEGRWDKDATGFEWLSVIKGIAPHAEAFERELEKLMKMIQQFAREAGVAITDVDQLPQGVREVVDEYADHRARRELAVARQAALPPPK